jgi:hypothetical protein
MISNGHIIRIGKILNLGIGRDCEFGFGVRRF